MISFVISVSAKHSSMVAVNLTLYLYTHLSVNGPKDSGVTWANLMNGFLSKFPTSRRIFDSIYPCLEHENNCTKSITCFISDMQQKYVFLFQQD